jgi:hypothetical protein
LGDQSNKRRRFIEAHVIQYTCPLVWFFSPKNSKQNLFK